jgi:dTMP kinase
MKNVLASGGTVLLDRYVSSNIASQCAKLKDSEEAADLREWIFNTEYGDFDLPRPDLNIFLDVPIGFVESKLKSQRGGADRDYLEGGQDIHEADIEFQKKVRAIYRRQCELDPNFIRIDCSDEYGEMLPPGAIFEKVRQTVDMVINR